MPLSYPEAVITRHPPEHYKQELEAIKQVGKETARSPQAARAFLIKMGYLTKDGKRVHPRYRAKN
ncbi:MAG: hypothetical protein LBK99_17935 [Opitutaceae bacterium]|jgi:hypothetical protein|nr:hypothetical protein [Opitutaceae bacterium]